MGNHSARRWIGFAAIALLVACGGKNKKNPQDPDELQDNTTQVPGIDPSLCEAEGKTIQKYDLDNDGRPDVWKLYAEGSALESCRQADLNFDGKKDYVVALNDRGGVIFEKFDLDFQNGFDAFYKYEQFEGENDESVLYEVQRDSNFDGKYDIIEKWSTDTRQIYQLQRDTNGDLKADIWQQYENGELVAILYDDEPYDGKVDRREEIKTEEDATKAGAESPAGGESPAAPAPDADSGGGDALK